MCTTVPDFYVGSEDWTQVLKLTRQTLYPLRWLPSPALSFSRPSDSMSKVHISESIWQRAKGHTNTVKRWQETEQNWLDSWVYCLCVLLKTLASKLTRMSEWTVWTLPSPLKHTFRQCLIRTLDKRPGNLLFTKMSPVMLMDALDRHLCMHRA